jgi:hypothetical protein
MLMRARAVALILIIAASIAAPAFAAEDERYSYITVQDVAIELQNETAIIHMNYSVDEGTRFIFFLLGKQDLKNKLVKILNYEDVQTNRIDLSSAEFTVPEAAFSYGNGIFWYPAHQFNVVIPSLTVSSPQTTRNYLNTQQFPSGMGFFSADDDAAEGTEGGV